MNLDDLRCTIDRKRRMRLFEGGQRVSESEFRQRHPDFNYSTCMTVRQRLAEVKRGVSDLVRSNPSSGCHHRLLELTTQLADMASKKEAMAKKLKDDLTLAADRIRAAEAGGKDCSAITDQVKAAANAEKQKLEEKARLLSETLETAQAEIARLQNVGEPNEELARIQFELKECRVQTNALQRTKTEYYNKLQTISQALISVFNAPEDILKDETKLDQLVQLFQTFRKTLLEGAEKVNSNTKSQINDILDAIKGDLGKAIAFIRANVDDDNSSKESRMRELRIARWQIATRMAQLDAIFSSGEDFTTPPKFLENSTDLDKYEVAPDALPRDPAIMLQIIRRGLYGIEIALKANQDKTSEKDVKTFLNRLDKIIESLRERVGVEDETPLYLLNMIQFVKDVKADLLDAVTKPSDRDALKSYTEIEMKAVSNELSNSLTSLKEFVGGEKILDYFKTTSFVYGQSFFENIAAVEATYVYIMGMREWNRSLQFRAKNGKKSPKKSTKKQRRSLKKSRTSAKKSTKKQRKSSKKSTKKSAKKSTKKQRRSAKKSTKKQRRSPKKSAKKSRTSRSLRRNR